MNYSREELIEIQAVSNQMRNAVYHLMRFMKDNGLNDAEIIKRLRNMGRNIAKTFSKYWAPVSSIDLRNLKDFIATAYKKILNSSVTINIINLEREIEIIDKNCALCKYHYEDIEVAGCEIILGFISELVDQINSRNIKNRSLKLVPESVRESQAYGNASCIQVFKYQWRERI
ncbi:MAG: hypothetical protein ACTSYC_11130 [Promethearchaeota archaeon]